MGVLYKTYGSHWQVYKQKDKTELQPWANVSFFHLFI